ncbi:MAG: hypothetical protein EZS28_053392, partial [Streblomastix strix]
EGQTPSSTVSTSDVKLIIKGGKLVNYTGGSVITISGTSSLTVSGDAVVSNDSSTLPTINNLGSGTILIENQVVIENTDGPAIKNENGGNLIVDSEVTVAGGVQGNPSSPQKVNVNVPEGTTNGTQLISDIGVYGADATYEVKDHINEDTTRTNYYYVKQNGASLFAYIRIGATNPLTGVTTYYDLSTTNQYQSLPTYENYVTAWYLEDSQVSNGTDIISEVPHTLIADIELSVNITSKINDNTANNLSI